MFAIRFLDAAAWMLWTSPLGVNLVEVQLSNQMNENPKNLAY